MTGTEFTFASMIHRGFLADEAATTEVTVAVSGQPFITHEVPMMTPGDAIGIPSRQVIRCTPVNGLVDAEPNYLATIEFDAPDLPWLFSRRVASGPIQPWITLAVVDVTDMTADPLSASPVGTQLTVDAAQLPNPAEAWMWAHGQLLGTDTVPDDPARSLSRLIGSRKLEADRHYLACVVPVFAAGRTAGLGTDPGAARTSMDLAWDPAGGEVVLPVYYSWRFGTGPDGDFEALVRRLHGLPLADGVGKRKLVLQYPMTGLPAPDPAGAAVELQVALRRPGAQPGDIRPLTGPTYLQALRSRLVDAGYDVSLLAADPPPVVGPPVYGQLAANATAATLETVAPPWLRDTNLDPRLRVAAGLGAEVVRRNQDRYVESAWRQVGDVLAANALRRRGEFSLAASATLHRKWLSGLSAIDLVTSTAPVHARVFAAQALTITGRLRQSPLPPAIVSVEYRRVARARGKATAWRAAVGPAALAARSEAPQPLNVAVPVDTIDRLDAPSRVWGAAAVPAILQRLVPGLNQTGMTPTQAAAQLDGLSSVSVVDFSAHAATIDIGRVLTAAGMTPVTHAVTPVAKPTTLTPAALHQVNTGTFTPPATTVHKFPIPPANTAALNAQLTDAARLIAGRQIVATDAAPVPGTALAGGFGPLRDQLVAALDPTLTIPRMVNHRISAPAAGLGDIMAAPDLSEPTYQGLAAISHDWLLPGIDTLAADTTSLVESNRSFISAFLVGMNHELARTLLWSEYPTDQRGTYARQFWAHRVTDDPTERFDLQHRLHEAPALTLEQLGEKPGQAASPLVLVVKGELVRRYPGMLVSAARTKLSGSIRTLDPATEVQPDFMARLDPDVLLVGFATMSADDVWAGDGNEDTAWWFFFAEHFTEPRFGLDEPAAGDPAAFTDWNDATWANAVLDPPGRLGADSFTGPPWPKSRPGTPPGPAYDWRGSSSSIAWILMKYPFRRGIRGTDLLPPRPA